MTYGQKAIEIHHKGYNCAQSVLAAYGDETGMDEVSLKRLSSAFGAGFGRTQNACGAVTGALMVIGCRYHNDSDVAGSKEIVYQKTREFIKKFEEKHHSIECLTLIGVDFNKDDGLKKAKEQGLFQSRCEEFIKDACDILKSL